MARLRDLSPGPRVLAGSLNRTFPAWEDWLTLGLAFGAVLSVAIALEQSDWSGEMPQVWLVSAVALLVGIFLARSSLTMPGAWMLMALTGAIATFWQTMLLVGPGSIDDRLSAIYHRFNTWFYLAFNGGISNDSLPFNTLIVGALWVGVFIFAWSLYRWRNPWLGLLPGGIALGLEGLIVGETTGLANLFFVLFGLLLITHTNLVTRIRQWQSEGLAYPSTISLSFLHHSVWGIMILVAVAGLAPLGPIPTPRIPGPLPLQGEVEVIVSEFQGFTEEFQRLSGPLQGGKTLPVHTYADTLPLEGSIDPGDRELMSVTLQGVEPVDGAPVMLRGASYDEYATGGWKTSPRREILIPSGMADRLKRRVDRGAISGNLATLNVTVMSKGVVGGVLFSLGEPVAADIPARAEAPAHLVRTIPVGPNDNNANLSDEEILRRWAPNSAVGFAVQRDKSGQAVSIQVIDTTESNVPDALALKPKKPMSKGDTYTTTGLVRNASPEDLRRAGFSYPAWVTEQYLKLPETVTPRIRALSEEIAVGTTPYDRVKAVQAYLREGFPVDYDIGRIPPGKDAVDHFLFETRRGPFDYHASAMVVILRAAGIPARLAIGFVITSADMDPESGAYIIRDRNSYAWAEVHFPGQGWIPFDAAGIFPVGQSEDIPASDLEAPAVPDLPIEPDFLDLPPGSPDMLPVTTPSDGAGPNYVLWAAAFALAALVGLMGGALLAWQLSLAGLSETQKLWEKTVRLASWAGHPPEAGQTPGEYVARLTRICRGVPDVPLLGSAYNRLKFARREPSTEEAERLRRMWPHLRGALVEGIFKRLRGKRRR